MLLKKSFCTENSPDRGREFRVRMWGTSSPDDKLTCDLANVIEAISIDDRGSNCLAAEKLAPGNLGLFQQHRPNPVIRGLELLQCKFDIFGGRRVISVPPQPLAAPNGGALDAGFSHYQS